MKKCLIIINNAAGKSNKVSFEKVEKCLGDNFCYSRFTLPDDGEYCLDGFDAVAVCGGDGTLGSLLEKAYDKRIEVFYFPSGTLNDRAKSKRYEHAKAPCPACSDGHTRGKPVVVGSFANVAASSFGDSRPQPQTDFGAQFAFDLTNGEVADVFAPSPSSRNVNMPRKNSPQTRANVSKNAASDYSVEEAERGIFSYVLAAGSFTPIGYAANVRLKKKLGVLAYVFHILKQYKIHRIPAKIRCGTKTYEGDFTLVMALKSPRCFGFRFNKAFDPESISGHLVAIRSPKHGGLLGLIEMFFPFFRVFFLGLKKEREGKIIFKQIYSCDIQQFEDVAYCRDGEKYVSPKGVLKINFVRSTCDFSVIEKF